MIKKPIATILAVILALSLTACGNTSDADSSTASGSDDIIDGAVITNFTGYGEHADTLMRTLSDGFWMLTEDKMADSVKGTTPITLWGYCAYMEAAGLWFELNPQNEEIKAEYLKTLNSVEEYRTTWRDDDLQVYQCWAGKSKAECFYDDDIWVVLEFINAYNLLGDEHWLSQAKGTAEFCYSGWDDICGGGVYWKEDDKASKNTCINAPLAWASCELYELTGEQYYLDWALKIYDWTKDTLLDTEDNTFWDNINIKGNIDKAKYSYNTGNMIGAAAALYEITGDAAYFDDAAKYAEGAYARFGGKKTVERAENPVYICDSNSWFGGSLLKGYLKLEEVSRTVDGTPEVDGKYVEGYAECLAYACSIANDNRGYLISGWTQSGLTQNPSLLDQSGNARLLFLLQMWKNAAG